jgi:TRAP-type transport system periplasmic protein
MSKRLLRAVLPILCLFVAIPAFAADAIKMNLNAIYPAGNFHSTGAAKFADLVKEYSNGSVLIAVHPGGSLGFKGPELLKAIKDGTVPMSDILMGVVQGSEKVFGVSSLPRMVKSYDESMKFYEVSKEAYEKAAKKWNQKILYVSPWPPSGLFSKKEINTAADIAGLKTRTYDKNGADFLQNLKGNAISLPWGEVYSALQTGMIDSVLTSSVSGKDAKLWEVLGAFKKINYAYPLNMVVINLDYWNGLTAEQKAAMEKAAAETQKMQWEVSSRDNEESLKACADGGIKISEESPELAKELDAAAEVIITEFLKDADEDVKKMVQNFRASVK